MARRSPACSAPSSGLARPHPWPAARRGRCPRPTRPAGPRRGMARTGAGASTTYRSRGRGPRGAPRPSNPRLCPGQCLVIPEEQLLVFLQRFLGDLLRHLDDDRVVLSAPGGLESRAYQLQPKFVELATCGTNVLVELL